MIHAPGDVILERYRIHAIHEGGMAFVYEAYDLQEQGKIAIKVIKPGLAKDRLAIDRFEREASSWVKLTPHPNIVRAFYVMLVGDLPYIFIEFIESSGFVDEPEEGADLRSFSRAHRISMPLAVRLVIQCCWGMQHVFDELSVVHRDLKPENLMITRDPTGDCLLKITDFGLVRATETSRPDRSSAHGLVVGETSACGTPPYMSPEQFLRSDRIDTRSDIYSLGCVLYELLCGRPPFTPEIEEDFGQLHTSETPEPPCFHNPKIPPFLNEIVLRCLEKDPEDRYTNFVTLRNDLSAVFEEMTGDRYAYRPDPSSLEAWEYNNRGISFCSLSMQEQALDCFNQAIMRRPDFTDAHYNLGKVLLELGRIEEARTPIDMALACDPAYFRAHFLMGHYYHLKGNLDQAEIFYNRALQLHPDYLDCLNNLGNIHESRGDDRAAERCWREILRRDDDYHYAHFNLSRLYLRNDEWPAAIEHAKASVEIAPNDARTLGNYGHILWTCGHIEEALYVLNEALASHPDHDYLHYALGLCLATNEELERAAAEMEMAVRLNSKNSSYLNDLAAVYGRLGKSARALNCLEAALEIAPDDELVHANLASHYANKGDLKRARYHICEAHRLDPDNTSIREAMRQICE